MPSLGDVFTDVRGDGRTMRISFHGDRGAMVVSLWVGTHCRGSFRMATEDLDRLISTLGEMKTSVRSASTTTHQVGGSAPEAIALDSASTAVVKSLDPIEPAVEQTGDVTGRANTETANISRAASMPVLRIA
jgi:hypothetical protein